MKPEEARIFISYARKDVAKVNELYDELKRYGFSPWIDNKDILPGQKWWDAIRNAIREAPFFLACLSNYSVSKRGVIRREVNEALDILREKLSDDIYLIPVRLEQCPMPEELSTYQWVDLFEADGFEVLIKALRHGLRQLGIEGALNLRSEPIKKLSEDEVKEMLRANDFYDGNWYWIGKGIHHEYEPQTINGDKVIIDHTTNLIWQQSGSEYVMFLKDPSVASLSDKVTKKKPTKKYITYLNHCKFAGHNDWRLPTLEEVMSLMEPKRSYNGLYINPLFDNKQYQVWTADGHSSTEAWFVHFIDGNCSHSIRVSYHNKHVRAVRSR